MIGDESRTRTETDEGRVRPEVGERVVIRSRTGQRPIGTGRREYDTERVRTRETRGFGLTEAIGEFRDRVRWGPILAGLLTALTSMLVLNLLGLAAGLSAVDIGGATQQGSTTQAQDAGRNSAIWAAISGIISFFLGGYVAARTAGFFDRGWGAVNGAMVFMLAIPLTLWLAAQGVGALVGGLGTYAGGFDTLRATAGDVDQADVARAAEGVRNGAWGALLGSLLGLASSALGGMFGARQESEYATRGTGYETRRDDRDIA
jgi:hypothetical protein